MVKAIRENSKEFDRSTQGVLTPIRWLDQKSHRGESVNRVIEIRHFRFCDPFAGKQSVETKKAVMEEIGSAGKIREKVVTLDRRDRAKSLLVERYISRSLPSILWMSVKLARRDRSILAVESSDKLSSRSRYQLYISMRSRNDTPSRLMRVLRFVRHSLIRT